jgi:hypothetical protein
MFSLRASGERKGTQRSWGKRGVAGLCTRLTGCPSPIPPLARRAPFLSPLTWGEDIMPSPASSWEKVSNRPDEGFAHRASFLTFIPIGVYSYALHLSGSCS